ncbi:MAG: exodeoxyribonuclease VII large subunit, partial [Candidatus Sumerlaeia bacterium]
DKRESDRSHKMDDFFLPTHPPDDTQRPLSVSELTHEVKRLLEVEIGDVEVEGEISNWSVSSRGHAYFNLKDNTASLSCVLFQGSRKRLDFEPEEGMSVIANGRISVYEARGQYQLIVNQMRQTGLGDLYRKFLELKEKLEKEGLFERKRPLPAFPRRIGIVTSATGAALRDIIHVIRRRFPGVELIIAPAMVQGAEAPPEIVRSIQRLNRYHRACLKRDECGIDVMIVGRGGGSIEDLWAFNDEAVARAIYGSDIPVISAVGHETDFTIADFVSDLRAPTPSAAAEVVVGEIEALAEQVRRSKRAIGRALMQMVEQHRLRLDKLAHSWGMRQPLDLVRQATQQMDRLMSRGEKAMRDKERESRERLNAASKKLERFSSHVVEARRRLDSASGKLDAMNPMQVLARGYSIVSSPRTGNIITREKQGKVGSHIRIQLHEGELRAAVIPKGEDFLDGLL